MSRTPGGGLDAREVRKIVKAAAIVFATCAGAGSRMLERCMFGTVVVDEASQAGEKPPPPPPSPFPCCDSGQTGMMQHDPCWLHTDGTYAPSLLFAPDDSSV